MVQHASKYEECEPQEINAHNIVNRPYPFSCLLILSTQILILIRPLTPIEQNL